MRGERRRSAEPRVSYDVITIEIARRIAARSADRSKEGERGRQNDCHCEERSDEAIWKKGSTGKSSVWFRPLEPLVRGPCRGPRKQKPSEITATGGKVVCCTTSRCCRKAEWEAEVDKIRAAYEAPIDAKDVDAIREGRELDQTRPIRSDRRDQLGI